MTLTNIREALEKHVIPHLEQIYPGFLFDYANGFVIREVTGTNWTNLSTREPEYMPFYSQCYQQPTSGKNKGQLVFSKPRTNMCVAMVFEDNEYDRLQSFEEESLYTAESKSGGTEPKVCYDCIY
jgi:hypothetical protein